MDKKQTQAACDYINAHVRELHGYDDKVKLVDHTGGDIGPDNVLKAEIRNNTIVVLVDRGIKGTPKYALDPKAVGLFADEQKKVQPPARRPGDK